MIWYLGIQWLVMLDLDNIITNYKRVMVKWEGREEDLRVIILLKLQTIRFGQLNSLLDYSNQLAEVSLLQFEIMKEVERVLYSVSTTLSPYAGIIPGHIRRTKGVSITKGSS